METEEILLLLVVLLLPVVGGCVLFAIFIQTKAAEKKQQSYRDDILRVNKKIEDLHGELENTGKRVEEIERRSEAAVHLLNDMKTVGWTVSARRSEKILEDAKLLDIDMSIC